MAVCRSTLSMLKKIKISETKFFSFYKTLFLPLLFTTLWYIDNLAIHNQYEDYSVLGFNCLDYFFQKYNISSKHCMYVWWFTSVYNKYDMQGKMKNIIIVHIDLMQFENWFHSLNISGHICENTKKVRKCIFPEIIFLTAAEPF